MKMILKLVTNNFKYLKLVNFQIQHYYKYVFSLTHGYVPA